MSAPSFAKFPGQVQTQGAYPFDPRNVVGAANSRYATKEEIPVVDRFIGLQVVDAIAGKLWMLIGGTANENYLDVLGLFVTLSSANQANGYAALDVNGKLANSVIPALAIGDTFVVANEAAMLATGAQVGDIAKRTDEGKTYVLQGADPAILGNWVDISSNFAGGIETINGKTGTNVTLNQDDVPDGSTYKRVTQAEKNTYAGKQDALGFDSVPTFGSTKFILSGPLFDYLKTIQSSINNKSFTGNQADGNNRFNLDVADEDIDQIIFVTEGGVQQHEGVHFTVDVAKRYIEWNTAPDANQTYYLKYLSNIPVVSLTSVAVENVSGLLENNKIKQTLLPLPTDATPIAHNAEGALTLDLSTHFQFPVVLTANVTQLNLNNGNCPYDYKCRIEVDNNLRTFKFAPDLNAADNVGIYSAGDKVTSTNGRIYKVATGHVNLRGDQFAADLAAGKWYLHIRLDGDNGYFPSQNDEDLLYIECLKPDYYKITPSYGS